MTRYGMTEALTTDHHFMQAGFVQHSLNFTPSLILPLSLQFFNVFSKEPCLQRRENMARRYFIFSIAEIIHNGYRIFSLVGAIRHKVSL